MRSSIKKIIEVIALLQSRRYPTLVILQSDGCIISTQDIQTIGRSCGLEYIDYRIDVLAKPEMGIILGAYPRGSLAEWLKNQARTLGGVIVENTDDIVATWANSERKAFFNDFLHTESNLPSNSSIRAPIIIISRLARDFIHATNLIGQGIVLDPEETSQEDSQ